MRGGAPVVFVILGAMNESALTQQEIDALLGKRDSNLLKCGEDRLKPVLPKLSRSVSLVLSVLFDRPANVEMSTRTVRLGDCVSGEHVSPFVVVEVDYVGKRNGTVLFCINRRSSDIFADLMMGGKGSDTELDYENTYVNALFDVFDQVALGIAREINKRGPTMSKSSYPRGGLFDNVADIWEQVFLLKRDESGVLIECAVTITGLEKTSFFMFIPGWFVVYVGDPQKQTSHEQGRNERLVPVRPVKFGELHDREVNEASPDFELIADVPLQVSAELGRTTMQLKDILRLHKGSVIELDRLAGEPADVFINGRAFAKGEVVVAGESFGVKIVSVLRGESSVKDD
jgi:flagellar motor switch protein FliN/FliY